MSKRLDKPREDLTGRVFGRLTVSHFDMYASDLKGRRKAYWACLCACGVACVKSGNSILSGYTKICGCLRAEEYAAQGERARRRNSKPPGVYARNTFLNSYKQRARRKGLEFSLSESDFFALTQGDCHYCGTPPIKIPDPRKSNRGMEFWCNGVDRIDSGLGYVAGNCVPCCEVCNKAKRDMPYDLFMYWINRLVEHRNARKID